MCGMRRNITFLYFLACLRVFFTLSIPGPPETQLATVGDHVHCIFRSSAWESSVERRFLYNGKTYSDNGDNVHRLVSDCALDN